MSNGRRSQIATVGAPISACKWCAASSKGWSLRLHFSGSNLNPKFGESPLEVDVLPPFISNRVKSQIRSGTHVRLKVIDVNRALRRHIELLNSDLKDLSVRLCAFSAERIHSVCKMLQNLKISLQIGEMQFRGA